MNGIIGTVINQITVAFAAAKKSKDKVTRDTPIVEILIFFI